MPRRASPRSSPHDLWGEQNLRGPRFGTASCLRIHGGLSAMSIFMDPDRPTIVVADDGGGGPASGSGSPPESTASTGCTAHKRAQQAVAHAPGPCLVASLRPPVSLVRGHTRARGARSLCTRFGGRAPTKLRRKSLKRHSLYDLTRRIHRWHHCGACVTAHPLMSRSPSVSSDELALLLWCATLATCATRRWMIGLLAPASDTNAMQE